SCAMLAGVLASFTTRRSSDLRASVPEQPTPPVLVYPATAASSTLYVPALRVTSVPSAVPGNEGNAAPLLVTTMLKSAAFLVPPRSEERRVGKECRAGWSAVLM